MSVLQYFQAIPQRQLPNLEGSASCCPCHHRVHPDSTTWGSKVSTINSLEQALYMSPVYEYTRNALVGLTFFCMLCLVSSIRCQLSNGTNYRTEEYRKISHEYWVVLMCRKCTAFYFQSMHCTLRKTVLRYLLSFFNKMVADASNSAKERHWLELPFV